jgi:ribosomal protein S27AE
MTKRVEKMICPDCGVEMNHHADKIDYTAALEDDAAIDPAFGGVVEEAHTCPSCGRTRLRRAGGENGR